MNTDTKPETDLLLSIDVGTTACKAGIFSKDGQERALSYNEYPLIYSSDNFIEQDANLWWALCKQSIAECVSKIPEESRGNIRALGISAQGISIVPVDSEFRPLTNAISWLDSRAVSESAKLQEHFGAEKIFNTTGVTPSPCYMLPKIMWLKRNRPDIIAETEYICSCQDFITQRLTGIRLADHSMAGGSMMYDMKSCQWSEELLEFAGVPIELLPPLAWAETVVGPLLPHVAEEFGLPEQIPVVLGGHDQECAGIGGGLYQGRVTASLGTASIMLGYLNTPVFDKEMRIPCLASLEKNRWVLEAPVNIGGSGLRWLRDLLSGFVKIVSPELADSVDYGKLMEIASSAEIGSGGVRFYPHFTGANSPYWTHATGMFDGLTLSVDIIRIVRSVLEGWCYQIRHNVEVIQSLSGKAEEVIVFGGGAKGKFLVELLADVLNIPVLATTTPETALLGAAMVAGVGCGTYKDIRDAQNQAVHFTMRVEPNPESAGLYEDLFRQYVISEKRFLGKD